MGQLAQHGIGIPDAGRKIFQCADGAGLEARRVLCHLHPHIVRVVVFIIIGMVLHRDRVQKNRCIRGCLHLLVLLDDLVRHGVIRDQTAGPVVPAHLVDMGHLFQAQEGVKAQVGVCRVPAPILGPEAMNCRRLISLRQLEVIGQREHGLGHMLLVGLAAVGQKGSRIACQRFKLHIAGSAAETGAVRPARSTGLLQGVEVGRDIGIKLETVLFQLRHIPVGLVHHVDDGGLFHGLVRRGGGTVRSRVERSSGIFLCSFGIIQDLVDSLL